MPKHKNAKRSRSGPYRSRQPSIASSVYKGSILSSKDAANNETMSIVLVYDTSATASATAINATWTMNNPANCVDWSDYSSSWDQFRVLGLRVSFYPNSKFTNSTSNSYAPIMTVIDRDTSTALVSYASADNYASLKVFTLDAPWHREMKMDGQPEAQWLNTQALPAAGGSIKTFASGLSNITFGRFIAYYRVQFRGRGI